MKFSFRDLLLATVIVAQALGWWLERRAYVGMRIMSKLQFAVALWIGAVVALGLCLNIFPPPLV